MSKTAFERDGILTAEERAVSARKCLSLLADISPDRLRGNEFSFLSGQQNSAKFIHYNPTERQLAWLRDLVSKYAA